MADSLKFRQSFIFLALIFLIFLQLCCCHTSLTFEDDQHTFYGLITPIEEGVQYQVELRCVEGCKNRPNIIHSMVTPRRGDKMGIVAINLSPFPSKANQAEPIRKLALKIWSVHALRKKERFYLWKVKAKDKKAGIALGNTIYHFQFGHFRASQEEGIYLRLKFNQPFPEPKTALKYALVAYGMNGKMLLEKIRELSEEEWKGGKEFVVQLNEAKMGPYLEKNGKPSILLAVKQFPEECSICKLETKERIGKFFGCSIHTIIRSNKGLGYSFGDANSSGKVVDLMISRGMAHSMFICRTAKFEIVDNEMDGEIETKATINDDELLTLLLFPRRPFDEALEEGSQFAKAFVPAALEVAGLIPVYDAKFFESTSEEEIIQIFDKYSLISDEQFAELAEKLIEHLAE